MLRKIGSSEGLVQKHDITRSRSSSHGSNKDNLFQRHEVIISRPIRRTGVLQSKTEEPSKYDQVPKRNFIIKTHVNVESNASDEDDDMLESITEDTILQSVDKNAFNTS